MTNLELVKNPNTPVKTLELLATDEDFGVRYGVAVNPNTPPETLKVLSQDRVWYVRDGVAKNPNATEEIYLIVKAYAKYGHLTNRHSIST